jgi:hypothetical protein
MAERVGETRTEVAVSTELRSVVLVHRVGGVSASEPEN